MALILEYQDLVVEESITDDSKVGVCIVVSRRSQRRTQKGILTDEVTD